MGTQSFISSCSYLFKDPNDLKRTWLKFLVYDPPTLAYTAILMKSISTKRQKAGEDVGADINPLFSCKVPARVFLAHSLQGKQSHPVLTYQQNSVFQSC